MPYRKVCKSCHTEYVDDDRAALEKLVFCNSCFNTLPDAIEYFDDGTAAAGQPPAEAQPLDPFGPPPSDGQATTVINRDQAGAAGGFGPAPGGFGPPPFPGADNGFGPAPATPPQPAAPQDAGWGFGPPPGPAPQTPPAQGGNQGWQAPASWQAPAAPPQPPAPEPRYVDFELQWVGTNRTSVLPVVLPDAVSGGYVGRDANMCDAIVDRPTISRMHFAYRTTGTGIEITNFSKFGTWVNGRLLQRNESAEAPAGSTIEMGGFTFELRERRR